MEQSNKNKRSLVWEQIYKIVKQIPRKEISEDAPDVVSVTTELEELFKIIIKREDLSKFIKEQVELDQEFTQVLDELIQSKVNSKPSKKR